MIRRLFGFLTRPLLRQVIRWVPVDDPWERVESRFSLQSLGSGARYDFSWFFEGESAVPVGSLHDLRNWLRGCRYVSDPHLFHERDYWQHPRTFEQLKRGDCEDFAIWSWRKLVELGYDADLVFGRCLPSGAGERGHAWVIFRQDGVTQVMEPTKARHASWICPLDEARTRYVPHFGITSKRERYAFSGWLLSMKEGWFATSSAGFPSST